MTIDWYAVLIARICPARLELIGGGPGAGILEQATPAQKKAILGGVDEDSGTSCENTRPDPITKTLAAVHAAPRHN